ncbi:MAG: PAQR family membrane homeostasis protein TrhA [Gammaproteobacteria bacterium]|uniref:PAQR family membrane homeostasis protein TrhA n=1 Tax=Azohydromonas sp. TaxID=1872666 RepID=UPI002C51E4F2|nr:hemolysin III family protein [Azohydromonas sp.]HMM84856.1 hemolysin III family protein [Azohydromonas sp.]
MVPMHAREQTLREEVANALSHGLGLALAVASLPVLVVFASRQGPAASVTGAVVFAVTMMLLYLVSTVYHALPQGRWKRRFNRLDHAAIFLFIAGSYTPFVLGPLRGVWGWSLFAAVWTLAAVGMAAKVLDRLRHPLWSTGLYVALGWMALVAIDPMLERLSTQALALIVAGGAAYTAGAVFFLLDHRVRYAHFVWHLFVIGGSTCHFLAALSPAAAA